MALINIDEADAEKKLSVIRKYRPEIINILLASAIVYLFVGQKIIENNFRDYMRSDAKDAVKIVSDNSSLLRENTAVLQDIKSVLIQNQSYLKDFKK